MAKRWLKPQPLPQNLNAHKSDEEEEEESSADSVLNPIMVGLSTWAPGKLVFPKLHLYK